MGIPVAVGPRIAALLACVVVGCGGPVVERAHRPARAGSRVEVEPVFAEWPTAVPEVHDATGLFAGWFPCVLRRSGRVDCISRRNDVTMREHERAELRFAIAHATASERQALVDEWDAQLGPLQDEERVLAPALSAWRRRPTPFDVSVALAEDVTRVAVGFAGGCAVVEGGRALVCWGEHGDGEVLRRVDIAGDDVAIDVDVSSDRTSLGCHGGCLAGAPHACAALSSGRVTCWGWNFVGQLGDGTRGRDPLREPAWNAPVLVDGVRDAIAISVGMHHSCALHADRTASCWGYGLDGQLGDGGDVSRAAPVRAVGVEEIVAIDAGQDHTCAVRADGRLVCWGNARRFGLRSSGVPMPRLLDAPEPLVEVIAGDAYTCARSSAGRVYCGGWY